MRRYARFWLLLLVVLGVSVPGAVFANHTPEPATVTVAGTIQALLGCANDWAPECENTMLAFDATDDVFRASFDLPAGSYEYKAALNGGWTENYGGMGDQDGANVVLELAEDTTVTFIYDHDTHWIFDSVNHIVANVPGNYQAQIGCPGDWAPDCLRSLLQDVDGDGVYTFVTTSIRAGSYEAKVALNESWTLNYGADGAQDGPNITFDVPVDYAQITFSFDTATNVMTISADESVVGGPDEGGKVIDLRRATAHWVEPGVIAWDVAADEGTTFALFFSAEGGLSAGEEGITGGLSMPLTLDDAGLPESVLTRFPHLSNLEALRLPDESLDGVPGILKMQTVVAAFDAEGALIDAASLQIPGVLDALYTYDGPLGVTWDGDVPTLRVWAPTARRVQLFLYADSAEETDPEKSRMTLDAETGVWSITGDASWKNQFYEYEVQVWVPSTETIERNVVTDPYSFSLSMNSNRSQIIDLNDPALMPEGWLETAKPALTAPEDIVLYELHVRDFSVSDPSVPAEQVGTFAAFTQQESNGMQHLRALAEAGLTHVHLLPAFDIATINEDPAERTEIPFEDLAALPADSEEQQALLNENRDNDAFNWGYDPYHYTVPEGSYSTNPDGAQRVLEFRQMVQSLNTNGLRVVMDVVYNHTNSSGQADLSVLDRIVPGYYHRLNGDGVVETSTCCQNTATEHNMMRKLMVDSIVTWATAYRVDGFRFDLMGHHMREDMEAVRAALDALTVETDGVDGSAVYVYGEGWEFGEVAGNARGVNATQLNMPGSGIGTFNDRVRDALRGGSPFGGWQDQGFVNGLVTDPNGLTSGTEEEQAARLLLYGDQIRVALAGNLRDYSFTDRNGDTVTGADIDYNGNPAGYTLDPQEHIIYASAHDNETLWDAIQYKAPESATVADRVRMNSLAIDFILLSQGVPFFHAGDDILRSKSMDGNSYNSGDWFNRLDLTYQTNNWGVGLPPTRTENWSIIQPLLADPALAVTPDDIMVSEMHFREMLQIRRSSPLFRLQTAEDVMNRLTFQNVGPDQVGGVIVMTLSDTVGEDLDPNYATVVVVFNSHPEAVTIGDASFTDMALELHPVQASSFDSVVQGSTFDAASGTFTVPGRTTAVFVVKQ